MVLPFEEDVLWTKEYLEETIQSKMEDTLLVVVSNRQPYSHFLKAGKIVCQRQAGGLVTALDPVMQATKGVWIATGTSDQDRKVVDEKSIVKVPPEDSSYSLKRIWLTKEEADAYYYGYSNEGLWPLCHIVYTRPRFETADWNAYKNVNRKFADAILDVVGDRPAIVWLQDYHLTLVPKYLREANKPNLVSALFWHIPWPNTEVFGICPQKKEILEGLLSTDVLGFHIRHHCDNFLATVDRELVSRIDRESYSVSYQDHETYIRPFPISIDCVGISKRAFSKDMDDRIKKLIEENDLEGKKVFVGVDRIDYTKGLPDKFMAIDHFFDQHPEYKGKVVFFQVGQVSRIRVARYKRLNDDLNALVEEINWKHSEGSWKPILFSRRYMDYPDILALYRVADACIVSSLHDGMNLVAKEFVATRADLKGVLLLSQFTGAARELTDALIINPYNPDEFSDAIYHALNMEPEEIERRMKSMLEVVSVQNIYRWAGKILLHLAKVAKHEIEI